MADATQRAAMQAERKALETYLKECDDFAIVPDVGGAWAAAWRAARAENTTPTLREAAQQALEALVHMTGVLNAAGWATGHADAAVKALRAALAEQDAEQASPAYLAEPGAAQATRADLVANWPEHNRARMTVALHYAAPAAEQAEPVAVPAGYALVRTPITEEMHVAAAKVLVRANGLDSTPQRMLDAMIAAAPPAPARQPAASLTVGMLMEAGLMVGSTPDSVGTSNWAVRMLGALRALAGDQPDAPPAPEPTWPEWAEQILKTVREYSGYDGYDDADGVDLHEEVCEALAELTAQIERLEAKAPAPARQEPLTDAQITEACRGIFLSDYRSAREYDFAIARAIERAHGITAAPAEGEK